MSKYTTELRYICETYAGLDESVGYDHINEVIAEAKDQIFEEYPIFDEDYRSVLNTKILRHYYTREICAETVGLWKLWLNNKMNEIMPYYNELYRSALLEFNPLNDVNVTTTRSINTSGNDSGNTTKTATDSKTRERDVTEELEGTVENDVNSNTNTETDSTNTSKQINRYSDTPQGGLNGLDLDANNMYLTNATINDESGSSHSETDGQTVTSNDTTENRTITTDENVTDTGSLNELGSHSGQFSNTSQYIETVAGKRGGVTYSAMIAEFRKTLINIDEMIIKELADLFFKLY